MKLYIKNECPVPGTFFEIEMNFRTLIVEMYALILIELSVVFRSCHLSYVKILISYLGELQLIPVVCQFMQILTLSKK